MNQLCLKQAQTPEHISKTYVVIGLGGVEPHIMTGPELVDTTALMRTESGREVALL